MQRNGCTSTSCPDFILSATKGKTNRGNVDYILSPNVESTSFYLLNTLYKNAGKEKKKRRQKIKESSGISLK